MSLNYLTKVGTLIILTLSVVACSSGGGHTQAAPNTPPLTDQSAAEKVEANRLVLLDKAKKAGLNDKQAADYAEANKQASLATAQATLEALVAQNEDLAFENALYKAKGEYYKAPKGDFFIPKELKEKSCNTNGSCTETISHKVIYNQDYSVVVGDYTSLKHTQSDSENKYGQTSSIEVKGIKTNADSIPKLGSALYSGKAFTRSGNLHQGAGVAKLGKVNYFVDFESRKGSGVIILNDDIRLNEGAISGSGITSTATTQVFDQKQGKILYKNGEYTLDFYGKKAEEIAGKVMFDGEDVAGFGGTRGEISK